MSILSRIFKKKGNTVKTKKPSTPYEIKSDVFFADISHWEPDFKASIYNSKVLINKCTDGIYGCDNTHLPRKDACANNGIKYVGYHFYQCYQDPKAQAKEYVRKHGVFDINPIIDYEKDKNQNESDLAKEVDNLYIMLCEVERITGLVPIIYSYLSILETLSLDDRFARFYLWLARYNKVMERIPAPFTPDRLVAWQYTDGKVLHATYPNHFVGIGNCDCNIYNTHLDLFGLKK